MKIDRAKKEATRFVKNRNKDTSRPKKLPEKGVKILKSIIAILLAVILCILLWPQLSDGVASLINQRFKEPPNTQGRVAGDDITPLPPMPTPESKPAIAPPLAEQQDSYSLAFFRSTLSYEEILHLGSETSSGIPDYTSIPMEKIELEGKPFLTEASIEGYDAGMLSVHLTQEAFDQLSKDLLSVEPLPFVVVLDGKPLFWGLFIHPVSSIEAPDMPLLSLGLESEQTLSFTHMEAVGDGSKKSLIKFFQGQKQFVQQIHYDILPHQKSLELVNFNSPDPAMVTLPLPEGWQADRREYTPVYDFTWKMKKNTVDKLREFRLYYDDKLEDTYYWGEKGVVSGELCLQGFYNESPYPGLMFNHAAPLEPPKNMASLLGNAWVYLLECDNYPAAMDEDFPGVPPTFKMFFVVAPIEGENLAYALSIPVPEGVDTEKFFPYVKQIMGLF